MGMDNTLQVPKVGNSMKAVNKLKIQEDIKSYSKKIKDASKSIDKKKLPEENDTTLTANSNEKKLNPVLDKTLNSYVNGLSEDAEHIKRLLEKYTEFDSQMKNSNNS